MAIRTLSDLDVEGRRVFLRVDLDVPLTPARGVADPTRLREVLPTIRQLLGRGARLVLAAHLGNPKGRPVPELSLLPVGAYLAEALGQEVFLTDEPVGDGARKVIADLREGGVALLENLRFSPGEEANEDGFARALAGYADVYVNEAFGASHRPHASVAGMVRYVSQRAMGPVMEREIAALRGLLGEVERPFVAVLGGARAGETIDALSSLVGRVDALCLGGIVGTTFLRAKGAQVGRSIVEEDRLAVARAVLTKAQSRDVDAWLPRDVVAGAGVRATSGRVVAAANVPEELAVLDIGPETQRAFTDLLLKAKTIFWHGPMGAYEAEPFAGGTAAVARAIATAAGRGAFTVVSGGDTAAAAHALEIVPHLHQVSTSGAAALEFLQERKLPGLAALEIG